MGENGPSVADMGIERSGDENHTVLLDRLKSEQNGPGPDSAVSNLPDLTDDEKDAALIAGIDAVEKGSWAAQDAAANITVARTTPYDRSNPVGNTESRDYRSTYRPKLKVPQNGQQLVAAESPAVTAATEHRAVPQSEASTQPPRVVDTSESRSSLPSEIKFSVPERPTGPTSKEPRSAPMSRGPVRNAEPNPPSRWSVDELRRDIVGHNQDILDLGSNPNRELVKFYQDRIAKLEAELRRRGEDPVQPVQEPRQPVEPSAPLRSVPRLPRAFYRDKAAGPRTLGYKGRASGLSGETRSIPLPSQASTTESASPRLLAEEDNAGRSGVTHPNQPLATELRSTDNVFAGEKDAFDAESYWENQGVAAPDLKNDFVADAERERLAQAEKAAEREKGEKTSNVWAMESTITHPDGRVEVVRYRTVEDYRQAMGQATTAEKPAAVPNPLASELAKTVSASLKAEATPVVNVSEAKVSGSESHPEKPAELSFGNLMRSFARLELAATQKAQAEHQTKFQKAIAGLKTFFTIGEPPVEAPKDVESLVKKSMAETQDRRNKAFVEIFLLAQDVLNQSQEYSKYRTAYMKAENYASGEIDRLNSIEGAILKAEERNALITELQNALGGDRTEYDAAQAALLDALKVALAGVREMQESSEYALINPELQVFIDEFNRRMTQLMQENVAAQTVSSESDYSAAPVQRTNNVIPLRSAQPALTPQPLQEAA